MTFRYLGLTIFMLMTPLSVVMPVLADEGRGQSGHRKVTGIVKEIKSELVTVETSGSKLTLNEKIADREGLKRLNVGEEYDIWVNENNTIIDVHPKGGKPTHSFLSGKLVSIDYQNSQVKLSTREGEKTLPLFPETRGFTALKAGTPVTVEIGETGKVVDIHRTTEKGSH